jgi:hypothetical protein
MKDWTASPDSILANLRHRGVRFIEAWYFPGASSHYLGHGAFGATVMSAYLIVGLTAKSAKILKCNFEETAHFNPSAPPNGPGSKSIHYLATKVK